VYGKDSIVSVRIVHFFFRQCPITSQFYVCGRIMAVLMPPSGEARCCVDVQVVSSFYVIELLLLYLMLIINNIL
jgi:hypothetical protein